MYLVIKNARAHAHSLPHARHLRAPFAYANRAQLSFRVRVALLTLADRGCATDPASRLNFSASLFRASTKRVSTPLSLVPISSKFRQCFSAAHFSRSITNFIGELVKPLFFLMNYSLIKKS